MERCSGASRAAERAKQCLGLVREAQASTGTRDWRYVDEAHESGLRSAQGSDRYGATRRLLREEPSRRPTRRLVRCGACQKRCARCAGDHGPEALGLLLA
jgi:hypothetical protein